MLEKLKKFVVESFNGEYKVHFERTVYWLLQLKPNSDEAMLIAAYAHDIERAFSKIPKDFFKNKELNDLDYLNKHEKNGTKIISDFLRREGYNKKKISRISNMVKNHEKEADPESNLIKDVDSISCFENNALKHIEKFGRPFGKDKVKRKFDFMYNRIISKEAKKIAKPMYKKAIREPDLKFQK